MQFKCRKCKEISPIPEQCGAGVQREAERERQEADNENDHCTVPEVQGREQTDRTVLDGDVRTENDLFYSGLGDEQIKRRVPFLNEVLRQMVTLSTTLMGGTIIFLKELVSDEFKKSIAIIFLFSLAAAFAGVLPHRSRIVRRCPDDIKVAYNEATSWKEWMLWISAGFLFVGLLIALIGIMVGRSTIVP